jgi:hypothetical protein
MKKLTVSGISDSAQFKFKSGTLQFLQDANSEAFAALCQALIGVNYSSAQVYILWGCINTGTGDSYIVSAGAVFYAGEIYLVDATTFSLNANVAIFSLVTTQYQTNADPVTFSDSSVHNIHDIRKMAVVAGTTGTMNYLTAKGILEYIPAQLNAVGTGALAITGTYPNLRFDVPIASNNYPALFAGSLNVGDVSAGGQDYTITFPSALATGNYYIVGTIVSNPASTAPNEDTTLFWTVRSRTSAGFILRLQESGNHSQNVSFEYIIFAK